MSVSLEGLTPTEGHLRYCRRRPTIANVDTFRPHQVSSQYGGNNAVENVRDK